MWERYLQVPKIADLHLDFLGIHSSIVAVNFEFEPALVGEVEQTDEAEACADFFHLVLRIGRV